MPTRDNKRQKILRSAVQVFAQKGFYNAKVADIARRAGVADGTIYLYFKNKDEILISIFEEEMGKFIGCMEQALNRQSDPIEKIKIFIQAHLQFVRQNPRVAQVLQLELRQSNKFIKEYKGSKLKEYLNLLEALIQDGQTRGVIRNDMHPALIKRALFGALDEICTHWVLLKDHKYDLETTAEALADLFIRGLSAVPVAA